MPLVIRYGAKRINKAGAAALEFPGLWATTNKECRIIETFLEQGE